MSVDSVPRQPAQTQASAQQNSAAEPSGGIEFLDPSNEKDNSFIRGFVENDPQLKAKYLGDNGEIDPSKQEAYQKDITDRINNKETQYAKQGNGLAFFNIGSAGDKNPDDKFHAGLYSKQGDSAKHMSDKQFDALRSKMGSDGIFTKKSQELKDSKKSGYQDGAAGYAAMAGYSRDMSKAQAKIDKLGSEDSDTDKEAAKQKKSEYGKRMQNILDTSDVKNYSEIGKELEKLNSDITSGETKEKEEESSASEKDKPKEESTGIGSFEMEMVNFCAGGACYPSMNKAKIDSSNLSFTVGKFIGNLNNLSEQLSKAKNEDGISGEDRESLVKQESAIQEFIESSKSLQSKINQSVNGTYIEQFKEIIENYQKFYKQYN